MFVTVSYWFGSISVTLDQCVENEKSAAPDRYYNSVSRSAVNDVAAEKEKMATIFLWYAKSNRRNPAMSKSKN